MHFPILHCFLRNYDSWLKKKSYISPSKNRGIKHFDIHTQAEHELSMKVVQIFTLETTSRWLLAEFYTSCSKWSHAVRGTPARSNFSPDWHTMWTEAKKYGCVLELGLFWRCVKLEDQWKINMRDNERRQKLQPVMQPANDRLFVSSQGNSKSRWRLLDFRRPSINFPVKRGSLRSICAFS